MPWEFHSMGCFKDQLLVGLGVGKSRNDALFSVNLNDSTPIFHELSAQGAGVIRDINSSGDRCAILRDTIYVTKDLKNWKSLPVSPSSFLRPQDYDFEENPFNNWSEIFNFATSNYGRIRTLEDGNFILLDPARAAIVNYSPSISTVWGKWGPWNDRMMFPKSMALLPLGLVAIADPPTKRVLFFTRTGDFIGILGTKKDPIYFQYPIDLSYQDGILSVADFFANQIRQFRVPSPLMGMENNPTKITRTNHFRVPEVLKDQALSRCLNCHDGYLRQSLDRFLSTRSNHFKFTQCQACHDGHHGLKRFNGRPIRLPEKELCLSCHKEKVSQGKVHTSKGCFQCHQMHGAASHQRRDANNNFCIDCHKTKTTAWHPTIIVADTDRAAGVDLEDKKIFCGTCHNIHGKPQMPEKFATLCSSCHGDKAPQLFKNFHKLRGRKSP
jgi:predicted CXXCH cytochrome family protein